jgi:AhpD family alkylhydroperoxidase
LPTKTKRKTAKRKVSKKVSKKVSEEATQEISQQPAGGLFGGHSKRTIGTFSFFGEMLSFAYQLPTIYKIWQKHEIEAGFREELMLAVSKLNDCKYCAWGHHEWAHAAGIAEDELDHIEHGDSEGIDRAKWVAISYVVSLVSSEFKHVPDDLTQEMQANYTENEIKEIILVARIMDIANRGANTWDAMLSRLHGKPAHDSHVLDEFVLSGVFWIVAPVSLLILSQQSERSFAELMGNLLDYVKQAEDEAAAGEGAGA